MVISSIMRPGDALATTVRWWAEDMKRCGHKRIAWVKVAMFL